jgi:transcriptional regulator with XRE-family HTH domain
MTPVLPERPEDAQALRDLLHLAVDLAGTQERVSSILGIDRSALSRYLSGARALGWHVVVAALRSVARRYPEAASRIVETIAVRLLDLRGTWVPDPDPDGEERTLEEESDEVVETIGRVVAARRSGMDLEVVSRELVRSAVSLVGAARRRAA